MYKLIYSDCHTHIASKALENLEAKVNDFAIKGFRPLGPAQLIKEDHGDFVAYITMVL